MMTEKKHADKQRPDKPKAQRRQVPTRQNSETELLKVLQNLQQKDELYRMIAELSNDGIVVMGKAGLLFSNQTYMSMMGYIGPEDRTNKALFFNIHPDDRDMVADYYRRRLDGEPVPSRYEFRMIRKDDTVIHVEASASLISYHHERASLIFLRDISQRKQAEEKVRESEEKYRLVVENTGEAINIAQDGMLRFANRASREIMGYPEEVLLSRPFAEFIHPEDRAMVQERHYQRIKGEKNPPSYEFRVVTQEGTVKWMEIHAVAITWEGRPATLNFHSDITERRKLEAELLQAQKMEAIGTLAGGIAHDFNNLLMGIQGYTSLMLLNIDASHPHYEKLKAIENQVLSGADLTRQLLGFARGGRYEVKTTDLNQLISKAALLFGRTKKEIRIHEKYGDALWHVEVDRGQMEQVLLNMFVNAWQAMPGGGSLYLEAENVTLDENYLKPHNLKPGPYVKISLTDTGVGMDEKTLGRIFDPFFTTKSMGRGTGLGLASAYGIIKGHGGMINVYSEKGHGTTFNIYLPASSKTAIREHTLVPQIQQGQETILIVDDEAIILDVSKQILENLGYRVLTAKSGQDALNIYSSQHREIDLVILDMIMPEMGGGETFDRLKAINPGVKAMLSSGYSLSGEAKAIMDRGMNEFIQKPFRIDDLSQKIRKVLTQ